MKILQSIKNILTPTPQEPDLVHPLFGELMAEVCGAEDDFWQSDIVFEPLNIEISLNVYAGGDGPSESQEKFYRSFIANYQSDFEFVAPALITEYEGWFEKSLKGEFLDNFRFVGISIPKGGNRNEHWSLSFDCLADEDQHMFTAEIENGVVTNVSADG